MEIKEILSSGACNLKTLVIETKSFSPDLTEELQIKRIYRDIEDIQISRIISGFVKSGEYDAMKITIK